MQPDEAKDEFLRCDLSQESPAAADAKGTRVFFVAAKKVLPLTCS
jgi:hypothetical protein